MPPQPTPAIISARFPHPTLPNNHKITNRANIDDMDQVENKFLISYATATTEIIVPAPNPASEKEVLTLVLERRLSTYPSTHPTELDFDVVDLRNYLLGG